MQRFLEENTEMQITKTETIEENSKYIIKIYRQRDEDRDDRVKIH